MTDQLSLFDRGDTTDIVHDTDSHLDPTDKPRLNAQCHAILDRLRSGPVTNYQLSAIALKYTARISDLRRAGYTIVCQRGAGGVNSYRLEE